MSEAQDTDRATQELTELYRQSRFDQLEARARALVRIDPGFAFGWKALGVACSALGRSRDALNAKARAVELLPDDAEARTNFGNALLDARRWADAEVQLRIALRLAPRSAQALAGTARLLSATGRFVDAAQCMGRRAEVLEGSADALNEWGNALRVAQQMHEARAAYERALRLNPRHVEAITNLGNTLADLGEPLAAEARYREALRIEPTRAAIHNNLGNLLKYQGRFAESLACYREALKLDPDFEAAWGNFLLGLNHVPSVTPQEMKVHAQAYGRWASSRAGRLEPVPGEGHKRKLRVGWVSGDFRAHPVGYFLESTLAHWASEDIELIAYPTFLGEDDLTQRIRPKFHQWTPIANLGDRAAAQRIAQDRVDVLVDLAGHTAHGRLGVFAWKPAPVQATWLGYFATTGIEQMDWLVADGTSVPAGEDDRFTESIWRLPGTRMCFSAPAEAPEVAPLPALATGHITFGSFQNLGKINDDVLALWSRVMSRVPGSRLRVQNAQLGEEGAKAAFRERLAAHGIDPDRASLHGKCPRLSYLQAHAQVDLVIDTFPYPGGTTTCEALWMGVPTVTLAGETMLSRQGASLLAAAGLGDWVAQGQQGCESVAIARASDIGALSELRQSLRDRVSHSMLFDAKRFAAELAQAFSAMSRRG